MLGLAIGGLASANIVFQDDFEGDLSKWTYQACPGAVTISTDAHRTGSKSAKFTVQDDDTHAKCAASPTENPRGQLVSEPLFEDGGDYFIAFSVMFPQGFPAIKSWFMIAELYGPPYNGTPSMALYVSNEQKITFGRDASYNRDTIWTGKVIEPGKWRDIVLHVKFSTDPKIGFVQIWDDGQRQQLVGGDGSTVFYRTLNTELNYDGKTPNTLILNQYRNKDVPYGGNGVTLYHDSVKVGHSYEEVSPA